MAVRGSDGASAGLTVWCQYNKGKCERSLGVAPHYSQLQRHEERDKEGLYDLVLTQAAQREQRRTSSCEANDSLIADVNVDLYCFQSFNCFNPPGLPRAGNVTLQPLSLPRQFKPYRREKSIQVFVTRFVSFQYTGVFQRNAFCCIVVSEMTPSPNLAALFSCGQGTNFNAKAGHC